MNTSSPLGLFDAYGIELEYMIVDRDSLAPLPISDKVLTDLAGELSQEVALGSVAWSNELVLHVIELKANGPTPDLAALQADFQLQIKNVNDILTKYHAVLMPTAMHPWLDPLKETKLWPHGDRVIYETYNRIFDCRGHGWSNLQSIHINLPFANDDEFGRLHAAIRLALPLLPAIAASSPFVEGKATGLLDNRLNFYRNNQRKIPSITGDVIPEACFTFADYDQQIFQKMYQEIAPHDPEKTLQEEWLNSRGAIARFDRNAIEIRVLDSQESLVADFAVIQGVVALVRSLCDEVWVDYGAQKKWVSQPLSSVLFNYIENGSAARINDTNYLAMFGYKGAQPTYRDLWSHLTKNLVAKNYITSKHGDVLNFITTHGNLSERMLVAAQKKNRSLKDIYQQTTENLRNATIFQP